LGNLVAVVATTTLAEGVDLPFRSTIVVDWIVWNGDEQGAIDPLLFRNLVGRSGRAGYHTEGDTYVIDNPLGGIEIAGANVRRTNQTNVMFPDSPPSLESVVQKDIFQSQPEGSAVVGSQFLASIPENPNDDDLITTFLSLSYFYSSSTDHSRLEQLLAAQRAFILDGRSGPLATAASPIQLTALGRAGNYTGLSPRSIDAVVDAITALPLVTETAGELISILFSSLVQVPEMTHQGILKSFTNSRSIFPVKPADIDPITNYWLNGWDQAQIFRRLPWVIRSKRGDSVDEWFRGELPESTWNEAFDSFVGFVDGVLTSFVPWILRACGYVSTETGTRQDIDWSSLADMIETGTNSPWASAAMRDGVEVTRSTLCSIDMALVSRNLELSPLFFFESLATFSVESITNSIIESLTVNAAGTYMDVEQIEHLARWMKSRQFQ